MAVPRRRKEQRMARYTIHVTVDDASIQVDPETLVMTSADDVQWAGTNARRFSIAFEDEAAFGSRELEHAIATTPQRARRRGRFKYSVISADDRNVVLDPIVIVGDPPTGGQPG
jgi:hypothetical protein